MRTPPNRGGRGERKRRGKPRIQRIPEITHDTQNDWIPRKRCGRTQRNAEELKPKMASMMSCAVNEKKEKTRATERKKRNAMQTKNDYDKSAKDLPPIPVGTRVRVYNTKTSRWDIQGEVILRDFKTGRSYRIRTTNDVCIFRNRRFIRPISRFDQSTKPLEGHVRYMQMR